MKKHIKELTTHISKNRSAWLMGILNVIASVIIAGGGIDISKNKTEISNGKNTMATLHKRISEQDTKIAKLEAQINWLKEYTDKSRTEFREDINNISRRLDALARK